jgi:hypothetical protein
VKRRITVLICGFLASAGFGQSSPSLSDTLKFLSGIVRQSETVGNKEGTLVDADTFESSGCVVTITDVNKQFGEKGEARGSLTIQDSFSLKDVDPNSVAVKDFSDDSFQGSSSVELDTPNFRNAVTRKAFGETLMVSNSGIQMDSKSAPRFAEALKHAILLCGGKASAFRVPKTSLGAHWVHYVPKNDFENDTWTYYSTHDSNNGPPGIRRAYIEKDTWGPGWTVKMSCYTYEGKDFHKTPNAEGKVFESAKLAIAAVDIDCSPFDL